MKLVERIVKVPRGYSDVEVLVSSCLHIGHGSTREEAIHAMVDYIAAAPNRRLILLGDVTDGISISDPRFNPHEVASWLSTEDLSNRIVLEAERAVSILEPIKDRIDALVCGNHELKPKKVAQVDIHRILWKGLGVASLDLMGFVRYTFIGRDRGESKPVVFYCEHGAGGAGNVGAVINKMVKRAKDLPGGLVYCGGHHHRNGATTSETVIYDPETRSLKRSSVLCVTAGTFLAYHIEGRTSYGEQFRLDPHGLGPGKVRVRPWAKHDEERVGYSFPYWA